MFILWNNIWKLPWICKTFHKQQNRAKKNKLMHKKITLHLCFLLSPVCTAVLFLAWWCWFSRGVIQMTYLRLYLGVMHNDTDNQVTCNFFIKFFVLFFPLNSSQTGHVQHTQYHTTYIYITQHKNSLSLSHIIRIMWPHIKLV